MKKINNITMLPVVCSACGHKNPEKHITFKEMDGAIEREAAKRKAMICDKCGFDNYTHNKNELEKEG